MITKLYALLLIAGGFVLATILSYYLNIRFDQKAVVVFLRHQFKTQFSSDIPAHKSGLNAVRTFLASRFLIKILS